MRSRWQGAQGKLEMDQLTTTEYLDLRNHLAELETDATKIGEELKKLGEGLIYSPGSVLIDTQLSSILQAERVLNLLEKIKQLQMKKAGLEEQFPELKGLAGNTTMT